MPFGPPGSVCDALVFLLTCPCFNRPCQHHVGARGGNIEGSKRKQTKKLQHLSSDTLTTRPRPCQRHVDARTGNTKEIGQCPRPCTSVKKSNQHDDSQNSTTLGSTQSSMMKAHTQLEVAFLVRLKQIERSTSRHEQLQTYSTNLATN